MASLGAAALTGPIELSGTAAEGGGPFDRGTAEQRPFRDELPRDARDRQRLRAALWDSLAFLRREARQPATPARRFTTADLLPPAES